MLTSFRKTSKAIHLFACPLGRFSKGDEHLIPTGGLYGVYIPCAVTCITAYDFDYPTDLISVMDLFVAFRRLEGGAFPVDRFDF